MKRNCDLRNSERTISQVAASDSSLEHTFLAAPQCEDSSSFVSMHLVDTAGRLVADSLRGKGMRMLVTVFKFFTNGLCSRETSTGALV